MADDVSNSSGSPSSSSSTGGKGSAFGFLTRKVGPLPLGVWMVAALVIYLYVQHRQNKGGSAQQTDPAGNVGTIDPRTGYVYGSAQDQQALDAQAGSGGGSSGGGGGGGTTGGQYTDNGAWGRAAVQYLVGLGEDPSSANEAIQQYLSSQPLTTQQQGLVNLAIQALGPPPQLPGPIGTPPPPIVTPPAGVTYATNPPTGVTVSGKTANTLSVKWNATTNATGYTVRYGRTDAASDGSVNVGASATSATIGGLSSGVLYHIRVQATPAKPGDPFGSVTGTTSGVSTQPPGGKPPSGKRHYTVVHGDTLTGIASKLHVSEPTLYAENRATIEAAAKSHGHPSSDNGHWIFPGTVLEY